MIFQTGSVSVLLGNGDGTLQAPQITAVGSSPRNVAVGDFNGDGRTDFAVGDYGNGTMSIFMNVGGAFTVSSFAPGGGPLSLAAADFNGDGRTDLAVGIGNVGNTINLNMLYGQAGGSLVSANRYISAPFSAISVADLNGDGKLDLAGAVPAPTNTLNVMLNSGNGTLLAPYVVNNPSVPMASQVTADFNGDGIPDQASATTGQIGLGLGDGQFGDTTPILGGGTVGAADVDGNGTIDVLASQQSFPVGQLALYANSPGFDNRTGNAVGFTLTSAQQVSAGSALSVTVTAVDALGNAVSNFLGTVDLDATLAGSTALKLAGQYSFTAADAGRHTFIVSNLTQAGSYSLTTYAVAMPHVSVPVTVTPGALAQFAIAPPPATPAGTAFSFAVTAEDKYGNVETGYAGTVRFGAASTDTQAVLRANYTFTAADAGTHSFNATLFKSAGAILSATDTATGTTSQAAVNVTPLAPATLTMTSLPGTVSAGTQEGVVVAALDVYGNVATAYTGTVHFSSTDIQASLPPDYTFSAGQGQHSFIVSLKTAGTQSLTVADTANAAFTRTQAGINVVPGTPTSWVVRGLSSTTTAGTPQTFTLTAMDVFGNVATNYTGQVQFSSSDAQALLPANYTFTAADAGSHTFTVTLKTSGTQSITAADTFYTALTTTLPVQVSAAAAATMTVGGFPSTTAGVAQNFTVTLRDAFGNLATGYTGTVSFASTDPIAALPGNYTFTAADGGVHTFTATLKKAGTQSITVRDTAQSTLAATQSGIAVTPGAVTHFAIVFPSTVQQGVGFSLTVSAVDDFGNVNPGYRGTVHLSSTDPKAGTQNFTFSNNDNGVHIFSYTFNTLGFQTLSIVDTVNTSIAGSALIDVVPKA